MSVFFKDIKRLFLKRKNVNLSGLDRNIYFIIGLLMFMCVESSFGDNSTDTNKTLFLDQCRRDCAIQKSYMVCGRYKAVKWLHNTIQKDVRFIFIPIKSYKFL